MEEYQNLPEGEEKPKLTKNEKKLEKYKDDMDAIDLKTEDYANGINQDRSCTDFMCLLVFGAFFVAMLGITGYTISKGNVDKMVAPVDYNLNFCGFGDRADYQKLYFIYAGILEAEDILEKGVCMTKCPEQGTEVDVSTVHPDDKSVVETYNQYYSNYGTPTGAYKSKSVIDYCLPIPSALRA